MDHSSQPFTLGVNRMLKVVSPAKAKSTFFHCDSHSVRTHYLLEIDVNQFMSYQTSVPEWVEESFRQTPYVVVRRGVATNQKVPIGVRGAERNQRWANFCHSKLVKSILTPPQLLVLLPAPRLNVARAIRALHLLKERWMDLDHPWGPGGSVGFELTTGKQVVKPASDLDVVIYADTRITVAIAKSLWTRTIDLPAVVDIRVETPFCGFSLSEFVSKSPGNILLRSPSGFKVGRDPWTGEVVVSKPK
jgi:phosphoribosyl-dephospho-CoA transferase